MAKTLPTYKPLVTETALQDTQANSKVGTIITLAPISNAKTLAVSKVLPPPIPTPPQYYLLNF